MNRHVTPRHLQPSVVLRVAVIGALLGASACKKGPDFEPPAPVAPESFRTEMPEGTSSDRTRAVADRLREAALRAEARLAGERADGAGYAPAAPA